MQQSRRSFLQTASLAAAAFPFAPLLAGLSGTAEAAEIPGKRRGLLFDESDLPRIRANAANPRFAECWKAMITADLADDTRFIEHQVSLTNHVTDMIRVRTILERTVFVFLVNGDPRQLELAKLAIRKLLEYPKWDLFLEGGTTTFGLQRAPEATIALAFALDWLGENLEAPLQEAILDGIATKGAPACFTTLYGLRYPDRVKGWGLDPEEHYPFPYIDFKRWPIIINHTNLKVIPIAGLAIAACLLKGRNPQADAWLEMARASAHSFVAMYCSDGSFGEGVSYWGYTTLHLALYAEVLWRTQGIDDRHLVNFPGSARYALTMSMPRRGELADPNKKQENLGVPLELIPPRYDIVNFGDANNSIEPSVIAWVGRTYNDPVARWIAREQAEAKWSYGMIWYEPDAAVEEPPAALLDHHMANDLVISRSGWKADDGVVAFRSGIPGNHEHADRNSVIFKAYGDRLLHDPFQAGYVITIERWKLRLTESHTAILINGQGHIYNDGKEGTNASLAHAFVIAFHTGPGWMTVTSDVTGAYQRVTPNVSRVERTLVFLKPDVLLLLDRVEMISDPATVQARFQVYNDDGQGSCSVDGPVFRISRPFATLRARALSGSDLKVEAKTLPLSAKEGVFPFAEIGTAPGTAHYILTACTAAPAGGEHGEIALSRSGGVWRAQGSHRGQKVDVTLLTGGEGPPIVTL